MPRRKPLAIPDELLDQFLAGSDPRTALAERGLLDGLKKALVDISADQRHPPRRGRYGRLSPSDAEPREPV